MYSARFGRTRAYFKYVQLFGQELTAECQQAFHKSELY
jgi:hypothetical protein